MMVGGRLRPAKSTLLFLPNCENYWCPFSSLTPWDEWVACTALANRLQGSAIVSCRTKDSPPSDYGASSSRYH